MIEYLWAVEVTEPPTAERTWARPKRFLAVAPDIEAAIAHVKERHPGVTFIKVIRDRNVDDVLVRPVG